MASGSAPKPNRQGLRLERSVNELIEKPLDFILNPQLNLNESLYELSGVLVGPDDSPYAGGHFNFQIKFPADYPFRPPEFIFKTPILHPNVYSETGIACHEQLLATWAPSISLRQLLTEMHSLLAKPLYDTPIEADTEIDKSPTAARQYTQQHAQPPKAS